MRKRVRWLTALVALGCRSAGGEPSEPDLSPATWQEDYDRFMAAQLVDRSEAGVATGREGAVTVAYNGLAARAGLEALMQGGNAIDAAMTAAMAQVALTAGAPISYFGIMSLVFYDAATDRVYTMNAEWNTILGEDDPMSIPGGIDLSSETGMLGRDPNGRTALVGGFMKGVEAAHVRFGRLPFAELFEPSIHIAETGMPLSAKMAGYIEMRGPDLARLPETKEIFHKEDGTLYGEGEILKQPALAATLRAISEQGADYMYGGPWGEKAVELVQADGGLMTLEDLTSYDVIWDEPLVAAFGDYEIHTNPPPNNGGVAMIHAQNLAVASGLLEDGHWTESGEALRKALEVTQMGFVDLFPPAMIGQLYPGLDMSQEGRLTREHADSLWARMQAGARPFQWEEPGPRHSDDVVVIDSEGNVAAITHSINTVMWGKTAIIVDGISISDAASFQQAQIARIEPGERLPAPTETGILFRDGVPVLGYASMGSGLHQRTFQGLLNVMHYGMTVDEAIDTPDFFLPEIDPSTFRYTVRVPEGFPERVLEESGLGYEIIDPKLARLDGEGLWVAISRDPITGELRAASHNRNNSAAVAH